MIVGGPSLTPAEANAQLLFHTVGAWELHVQVVMGLVNVAEDGTIKVPERADEVGRLAYGGRTVTFGTNLDSKWKEVVTGLKPQFRAIAQARHWYFHNMPGDAPMQPFAEVFAAMSKVVLGLEGSSDAVPCCASFKAPTAVTEDVNTSLLLQTPSVRMIVPVARVGKTFVGRNDVVDEIAAILAGGARVLVHGPPGAGKDTVMAEVAYSDEVQSRGGLQAWLQASSDVVLQRQLIELFATHRPVVVRGLKDPAEMIASIGWWLRANTNWVLFVEDANASSATLWSVLPEPGMGGCLLVTSQSDLSGTPLSPTRSFKMDPISTDDSIWMLRCDNVFMRTAPSLPEEGSEEGLRQLCVHEHALCYILPAANEKGSERKKRHRSIAVRLFEHDELSRPELRVLLEDTLGNLPLSVAQTGHILRADPRVSGVTDLIALFKHSADLAEVDRAGRNAMWDTHYFGLYLSVKISLDRLRTDDSVADEDRDNAETLLAVLSLLDNAQTPLELLQGHSAALLAAKTWYSPACRSGKWNAWCTSALCALRRRLVKILANCDALGRARVLCVKHGLLEVGAVGIVGVMHQLVQKCLFHQLIVGTSRSHIVDAVRAVLEARFVFDEGAPSEWRALRRLVPCVLAWGSNVGLGDDPGEPKVTCLRNDLGLAMWVATMFLKADGKSAAAASLVKRVIAVSKRVIPADHPHIATLKETLVTTYLALGRHKEALALQKEVVSFCERKLPVDHPDIALAKSNLAVTYLELRLHKEALALQQEVVASLERVLPADHAGIATFKGNLAMTYSALGRHKEALALHLEVVACREWELPENHPGIAQAKSNLALTYSDLGRHKEALVLKQDVLAYQERVLLEDHPNIAQAKGNLAMTYCDLGWYEKALTLNQEVVAFRERVLPADHPAIATSKGNLASTYNVLARHKEALTLQHEVLAFRERVLPADHPDIALSKGHLAVTYSYLGWYDEALALQQEVMTFYERVLSADHPHIATLKSNLALTCDARELHKEALALHLEVVAFREQLLPEDHPDIAHSKGNLALTYSALGRHKEALVLQREVVAFRKRVLPEDHPDIAQAKSNLALAYSNLGWHKEALALRLEVLAFNERALPADHIYIANSKDGLASTYHELWRFKEALMLQREVLAFRERVLPVDHPEIARAKNNLAQIMFAVGDRDSGVRVMEEAIEVVVSAGRVAPDNDRMLKFKKDLANMRWLRMGAKAAFALVSWIPLAFHAIMGALIGELLAGNINRLLASEYSVLGWAMCGCWGAASFVEFVIIKLKRA